MLESEVKSFVPDKPLDSSEVERLREEQDVRGALPLPTTKLCTGCNEIKDYSEYHLDRSSKYGIQRRCKSCKLSSDTTRQERSLRRKYGLTVETYKAMYLAQHGRCAICKRKQSGKNLSVDHDHSTGKVRALLCSGCNFGLGWFEDNVAYLMGAIDYLTIHDSSNGKRSV